MAAVARLPVAGPLAVTAVVPADAPVVVFGHSLGGVVGLTLAGRGSPLPVRAVIGLGIKVTWTDADLDRSRAVASRPPAWFASRDEAAARYLRVSGAGPDDGQRGARPVLCLFRETKFFSPSETD